MEEVAGIVVMGAEKLTLFLEKANASFLNTGSVGSSLNENGKLRHDGTMRSFALPNNLVIDCGT